ncbi:MAG: methyltransferase domain-containing protein [Chloroflexi bacterium]|nr:methyltransferase domain-containing protein [Chloroflexota bacterium]
MGEDEGRRVLLVDGVVQSVLDDAAELGYWAAMVPDVRPERALILGVGGGTIVRLLRKRFGSFPIVGVDDDADILAFAGRELADAEQVQLVEADAFEWTREAAEHGEHFDLACVDVFRADAMPADLTRKPFLRAVRRLLEPRGRAVFNLFADRRVDDRIRRIERVLEVVERQTIEKNAVVWCRP